MGLANVSLPQRSFGQTMRRDAWWIQPLLVFLGLSAFVLYSTWAAFQGENYYYGPYYSRREHTKWTEDERNSPRDAIQAG